MFYLDQVSLEGFRNYKQQFVNFHPSLNIITGDNAQGKTNLLESIFFLAVNRSFRTRKDHELAHFDGNNFNLKGVFIKNDFSHIVQVCYRQNSRLLIKVNSDHIYRYDHIREFPVVVFCPDDLQIISEGPSIRRRFINLEASRLDPAYLKELKDYQRVLNQRNRVLKDVKNWSRLKDLLAPWDQALVTLGVNLIRTRINLINELEQEAKHFFAEMTGSQEALSLEYAGTVQFYPEVLEMQKQFHCALLDIREQELRRCTTLIGPHLDDINISINGYNTRLYSSQGQKRTAALALKMGEVSLFKQKHDLCPIILLDDVFSELDAARKQHLLEFLRKNGGQCFITSAVDLSGIIAGLNRRYKHILINRGSIINEAIRTGD